MALDEGPHAASSISRQLGVSICAFNERNPFVVVARAETSQAIFDLESADGDE